VLVVPGGAGVTGPVRVLAAGVDSLYASVADGLTVDTLAEAINHRAEAQDSADTTVWEIPGTGRSFETLPHGFRKYVACLRSPAMEFRVGPEDEHRPALMIEWRSPFLHQLGVARTVEEAEQVARYFCLHLAAERMAPPPRPSGLARIESDGYPGWGLAASRVDLYAQGWSPDVIPPERFVTRRRGTRPRTSPSTSSCGPSSPRCASSRMLTMS
jgi:hypothetical protein